jgi:TPP-dependent pyruvate/acetoin dehydrogenase alpha subunit
MITVDYLKNKFQVTEDQELAAVFDKSGGAISKWRKFGVPAIVERKAYALMAERGIVADPQTPYRSLNDMDALTLDQTEKRLLEQWRKKGEPAMLREIARMLEEEAEEEKATIRGE